MTTFTKTDFIHYLTCAKSLWLEKHKPEVFPRKEFSDFLQKITREGYEVESYAQKLFPNGVSLPAGSHAPEKTKEAVASGAETLFQATVCTEDGLFARADILVRKGDSWSLYEVKSSTKIDRGRQHNHILDACFQKIVFERAGYAIGGVYSIYVNKTYRRGDTIVPEDFLVIEEVTEEVAGVASEVSLTIKAAQSLLQEQSIDETKCSCFHKTRANHCDAFSYFNGTYPVGNVWELTRITEKRLGTLLLSGVTAMQDVPVDAEISEVNQRQVCAAVTDKPVIDQEAIRATLESLVFPLIFLDYETYSCAVPKAPGMRPYQHILFQFSLHLLHSDGSLEHREFLGDTIHCARDVVDALQASVPEKGSVISWHAAFERGRNREVAEGYPSYEPFLTSINDRMVDLEDIFKESYTDVLFRGSTSIKKVLPVLCPDLSYKELAVQDGTQAMDQWLSLVEGTAAVDKEVVRKNLLAYCKLDTYAMVEIYRTLQRLVST